jgi:hypothetical protein
MSVLIIVFGVPLWQAQRVACLVTVLALYREKTAAVERHGWKFSCWHCDERFLQGCKALEGYNKRQQQKQEVE